jgi:hypothetical protein
LIVIVIAIMGLPACDHGIAPPAEVLPAAGKINGTISYSNWPEDLSSIRNLKVVVFTNFPPGNILEEVINGKAIVYPPELNESLPKGVETTTYTMELPAGTYEYVVVAQQFGGLYDWRAVGQYDTTPQDSLPTPIVVTGGSNMGNIDITVDFDNLPIQPF